MTARTQLPADIARCYGERDNPLCKTCARRSQVERDDPTRYYPYMSAEPIRGRCVYRIEEEDDA